MGTEYYKHSPPGSANHLLKLLSICSLAAPGLPATPSPPLCRLLLWYLEGAEVSRAWFDLYCLWVFFPLPFKDAQGWGSGDGWWV